MMLPPGLRNLVLLSPLVLPGFVVASPLAARSCTGSTGICEVFESDG